MEALTRELERVLDMAENELDMALDLPEVIQRTLDFPDEMERMLRPPARTYVKRAKAFLRTPADIYEYPDSYAFVLDMPGLEPDMIKVNVEDGRVLHVLGKRRKKPAAGDGEKKAQGETKEEGGEGATTTPIDVELSLSISVAAAFYKRMSYCKVLRAGAFPNPDHRTPSLRQFGILDSALYREEKEHRHALRQVLPQSCVVLMDMVARINLLFEKHFQTRIFNLKSSVSMRNLNPYDSEKMVSVKGMIMRCSS
ncbi:hypothetical protein Taro_016744 [Colocasia esculenta]|uniref:SHSP domain-containing protein n=1 Tax=Colocasia esculenta TaxID=4460 RepID=A0A843UL61_COLES|nr:hypothetical protein [Colocasia esculenta]